tara:strand:- start:1674 stop:3494 length:1821 start_codon:yes stop_codon:yes gene_type:complete
MISFKSHESTKELVLGGITTLDASAKEFGVVGPFPRYSISREDISTEDGTHINSRFVINVTGTATLKTTDDQDMLNKGQRQSRVQGEALILAQLNRNQWPMRGNGVLEIAPYGGHANIIKYNDARILSIELPEQNETSAGVQYQEYTVQFEAFEDGGVSNNTSNPGDLIQPTYNLSNVEESWEFTRNDQFVGDPYTMKTVTHPDTEQDVEILADNPGYSFTLTHTLNAVGIQGSGAVQGWERARDYIDTRVGTGRPGASPGPGWSSPIPDTPRDEEPLMEIQTNILNLKRPKADPAVDAGVTLERATVAAGFAPGETYANHVRNVTSSVNAGSYGVTDTWIVLPSGVTSLATMDIEVEENSALSSDAISISVAGTITGFNTIPLEGKEVQLANHGVLVPSTDISYDNRLDNATAAYNNLNLYNVATASYTGAGVVRNVEFAKTVSKNEGAGSITFSSTFNDLSVRLSGVIEDSVQISETGGTPVIALIGVLLKATGPVYQEMGTITEQKKSVSYTAKVQRDQRGEWTAKMVFGKRGNKGDTSVDENLQYDSPLDLIEVFAPGQDTDPVNKDLENGPYIQNKTEDWNEDSGDYTLSREWVYSKKEGT